MKKLLIKISEDKIFFANNNFFELSQTNFPKNSISFRYHAPLYLIIEIINYDSEEKRLEIKVIDYDTNNIHEFKKQEFKILVNQITFKDLEWEKLKKVLSVYDNLPLKIPEAFKRNHYENTKHNDEVNKNHIDKPKENFISDFQTKEKPLVLEYSYKESFENLTFHNGFVSVEKHIDKLDTTIKIELLNEHILSEYENIKPFFSKYLKRKYLNINLKIEVKNNKVLNIESHSKEIDAINNRVIKSVKLHRVSKIINYNSEEKIVFTEQEILKKINPRNKKPKQETEEILKSIIELKNPRNKKQLIYLSGEKQDSSQQMRFTSKPFFGFIFFITESENKYICWELLDSHATYLWKFPKSETKHSIIKTFEEQMAIIKQIKRQKYRRYAKENSLNYRFQFNVITHSLSTKKNNFNIWKNKLDAKLK